MFVQAVQGLPGQSVGCPNDKVASTTFYPMGGEKAACSGTGSLSLQLIIIFTKVPSIHNDLSGRTNLPFFAMAKVC